MTIQEVIAGVDEVGRGCLFGPVVAAAAIVPDASVAMLEELGVTDSKKLSAKKRDRFYEVILDHCEVRIGWSTVREIDRINILQASLLAMKRAIAHLQPTPTLCLVDGNRPIPTLEIPQRTVVKGDQTELAIAAASIIAKVWRDRLIIRLDQRYPGYDLASNKGYGSRRHRQAIAEIGITPHHRLSFSPCRQMHLQGITVKG